MCWAFPRRSAERILAELAVIPGQRCIDGKVGAWAREHGLPALYHSPSLVQHIADDNSAVGGWESRPNPVWRTAADFVGEEAAGW